MILPAWLLFAWRYLKPALPYLAAAAALWFAYHVVYDKGRASRQPEIAALNANLATSKANVTILTASLARQNAATAAAAQQATDAQKAAHDALAAVDKANAATAGYRDRAKALAKVVTVGPCDAKAGDALSRDSWSKL